MPENILLNAEERMEKSIDALKQQLAAISTGRANPAMLEGLKVNYYGAPTPVNQLAAISVPEGNQLLIKPFDRSVLSDIESAINKSDLSVTPQNDGEHIRIMIPMLTEDRRRDTVKRVGKAVEAAKVSIRNIRRDANDSIKKLDELTEDQSKGYQDDIQKTTDKYVKMTDELGAIKEKDIMTV